MMGTVAHSRLLATLGLTWHSTVHSEQHTAVQPIAQRAHCPIPTCSRCAVLAASASYAFCRSAAARCSSSCRALASATLQPRAAHAHRPKGHYCYQGACAQGTPLSFSAPEDQRGPATPTAAREDAKRKMCRYYGTPRSCNARCGPLALPGPVAPRNCPPAPHAQAPGACAPAPGLLLCIRARP